MAPGILLDPNSTGGGVPVTEQNNPPQSSECPSALPEPIAIIGMGCRLPGDISKPSDLWALLEEKRTGWKEFSSSRLNIDGYYHPNAARPGSVNSRGAHLLDCDPHLFDHSFFSMQPSEVLTLDPMQRKLVEVSYEAMEAAGEPWEKFSGSRTGVFVGNFAQDYSVHQLAELDFAPQYLPTGAGASILSNRINHVFNLKGPSLTVDTACASSMYALHLAVNAIRAGDCDAAIVGGSNIILGPQSQQMVGLLGALSGTSICHTFDEAADGYSRAEGFCALYLKRYSEAVEGNYPIRGVIRGTAVNSNGKTAGISHPSSDGQEALIRQAYKNAGLPTHLTAYFECHGTGTPVGDPIEVSAVAKVFGPERGDEPLLIGSVKTNLGHSEAASGITGVMKSILALEKGMIPATVGIQRFNPNIDFDAARVKVVTEMTPWPQNLLRRVSVNSFGFGGANGHCIIDHPEILELERTHSITPKAKENHSEPTTSTRRLVLLPFSAHDQEALELNIAAVQDVAPSRPLADLAYTLSRRSQFLHKTFAIVDTESSTKGLPFEQIAPSKTATAQSARIGFVFTGQGAQWRGMGQRLFEYAVFRASIERQDSILASMAIAPSWTLRDLLTGGSEMSVENAEISQTICTALQVALVDLLRSWDIFPQVTVGHSSGEIAAAYAAGRISIEEAIVIAYCRGKSAATNTRQGSMLAVGLGMHEAVDLIQGLESSLAIAAVNSPSSVTLSGDVDAINQMHQTLQARDVFARHLRTGGNAYHSHHMKAVGDKYETMLEQFLPNLPTKTQSLPLCQWISSVNPHKIPKVDPTYWRENMERTVRFSSAVERLISEKESQVDILIEIGPHSALQSPLKQIIAKAEADYSVKSPVYLTALRRSEDGMQNLLNLCGSLYQLNHNVNLAAVNSVDSMARGDIEYIHGKICTEMPPYRYSYGPVLFYESRVARERRLRENIHHDLIGVLQPGGARDHPTWRNVLRLKHIPWLNDHQLIPNAVMPGAAYVCIGIEAASQFIDRRDDLPTSPVFRLRNVSIKNALRIPDDDLGIEMVTTLSISSFSPNWLQFTVTSVDRDGTWTDNASGLVSITKSSSRECIKTKRLDERMDHREVDILEWYEKFTEVGLGYGKTFRGLSNLQTDPYQGLATAKLDLNTTATIFSGPESRYAIHPASLDICFQLALIAVHGGHTDRVKHAFIPVAIDELSIWPPTTNEDWGQAIAKGKITGLRGLHTDVQIFDQSGLPRMELKNLGCVSYYGGVGKPGTSEMNKYVRLAWKPDISNIQNRPAALPLSSAFKDRPCNSFVNLIDLISHRNPDIKILQIGVDTGEVAELVLRTLGGGSAIKRYSTYTLIDGSNAALSIMAKELSAFKHVAFKGLEEIEQSLSTQGPDGKYDLVLIPDGFRARPDLSLALESLRKLISEDGRLMIMNSNLDKDQWQPLLKASGFSGVDTDWMSIDEVPAVGLMSTAVTPMTSRILPSSNTDLLYIVYDRQVSLFHESLAEEVRKRHIIPIIVGLGSVTTIPVGSRVIMAMDLEPEGLARASEEAYNSVRVLTKRTASILWLTKASIIRGHAPEAAVATGLMRVLASEKPESQVAVFHLGNDYLSLRREVAKLIVDHLERLSEGNNELEVALHNGAVYIPRLVYDGDLNARFQAINSNSNALEDMPLQSQGPIAVDFSKPGLLTSAYFKRDESLDASLPADYVEIQTSAISLNWKDIAVATGRNDMNECSSECAGTIVACGSAVTNLKPGDRVYALAWSKFATRIRTPAGFAQRMDSGDTFEQMSTIPIAYATAVYGLLHLSRVKRGTKVLIQSATGGLGLAALQVAKYCNADIYVTVGTPEKSAHLRKHYHIAGEHIFSSRDEGDIPAMMAATGGKGFDVILNTSVGDMMHATWRCIAPRGHFIDVGRLDVQRRSTISMEVYDRNATFSSFDLSTMSKQDPEFSSQLMEEVGSLLRAKLIQPITEIQTFDISELHTALLSFSQGIHIGKFVMSYENPNSIVKMLPPTPRATFDPDAEYVHVGGLGGLGRSIIRWFVARGARHITVFSRSGSRNGEAKITIEETEAIGATITLKAVDVTNQAQLDAAVAEVARRRPVRGILHAAVSFAPTVIENMSYEEWKDGLAAKVQGTINLHKVSISQNLPLDFFVMTSSIQSVLAMPAHGGYCAGNTFQDAFARYRRSIGLTACAIGFGLITEITSAGASDFNRSFMRRNQLYVHGELEFLQLLEAAFLARPVESEASDSWTFYDHLASAQMLAYGDPRKLAVEFRQGNNAWWRDDTKFSHVVRAAMDHLSASDQPVIPTAARPAIAAMTDVAIKSGDKEAAVAGVAKSIAKRMASLLSIETESISTSRSVAAYGVDSLIAVELRTWIVDVFETAVPLLKLLDERTSMDSLAEWIVEERAKNLEPDFEV